MPIDALRHLAAEIAGATLLSAASFRMLDCDAALESRDQDAAFEGHWLRLLAEVDRRWSASAVDAEVHGLVEDRVQSRFCSRSRLTRPAGWRRSGGWGRSGPGPRWDRPSAGSNAAKEAGGP